MRIWLTLVAMFTALGAVSGTAAETNLPPTPSKKVFVLPIRDDIMPPLLYLVRRGVKEAMEAGADLLILDMETNGGRVDTTREIISILNQFKGETATFVNKDAFSAGAFISVATKKIYMAPEAVIGAAAPIIMSPGGEGVEKLSDTYEKKMTSAVKAMIRAVAEKNGHNVAVVEAMIDKTKGLTVEGTVIIKEGEILTLTNTEAEKEYGTPPKRLLSSGTVKDVDELIRVLGYEGATRSNIKETGMEKVGSWLNAISPILLIIGMVGIYIEMKSPGFGLAGVAGITAFALYFLGGYVAGLSGAEWIVVFVVGLALVIVELFIYPGHLFIGLAGAALMLAAIVMAMVDVYPSVPAVPSVPGSMPSLPAMPTLDKFELPMRNLLIALVGGLAGIWAVSRLLPNTPMYRVIVSKSASGAQTQAGIEQQQQARLGRVGVAISVLRPGGKAQFDDDILDVVSQGDLVDKGTSVRIIGSSGAEALVEVVKRS